jgi:hypothetical protein
MWVFTLPLGNWVCSGTRAQDFAQNQTQAKSLLPLEARLESAHVSTTQYFLGNRAGEAIP